MQLGITEDNLNLLVRSARAYAGTLMIHARSARKSKGNPRHDKIVAAQLEDEAEKIKKVCYYLTPLPPSPPPPPPSPTCSYERRTNDSRATKGWAGTPGNNGRGQIPRSTAKTKS